MILVTAEQMREMDRRTIEEVGIPGVVLMEHAAQGAVDALLSHFTPPPRARKGVKGGGGNNGLEQGSSGPWRVATGLRARS